MNDVPLWFHHRQQSLLAFMPRKCRHHNTYFTSAFLWFALKCTISTSSTFPEIHFWLFKLSRYKNVRYIVNNNVSYAFFFCHGSTTLVGLRLLGEVPRSQTHSTLCRTPLDEFSTRGTDLCLLTHDTHHTPCPPAGFEHAIQASERPQTRALDRAAATGIDFVALSVVI